MKTHHCPKCDLRFRDHNEVKAHLIADHGMEPERLEEPLHRRNVGRIPPDPSHESHVTEP
jgi:hypothetical protein